MSGEAAISGGSRMSLRSCGLQGTQMKASELFDLTGQVALVTGASSGLGVGFAQCLAENGAAVALVARRTDRLAAVKEEIERAGGHAVAIEADVLDRTAIARAFDQAEAALGTVTILVNNAGVAHGGRAVDLPQDEWRRGVGTNLDAGVYWPHGAGRPLLAANKRGAIVNIASILGLAVHKGIAAYGAAKAGVIQLTKSLAIELTFRGVRVNAIAPGFVITELNREFLESPEGAKMTRDIPAGRFGETRDLDGVLLLLASVAGRYISGATYVVDCGQASGLRG